MLDPKIKNRIDWFCINKVNDFSPTISPAPKDLERREIESPRAAIRYFMANGVNEFVVQKKYMGSYCSIYLKNNLDDTYFVSRNGFKIEHIDLEEARKGLVDLHAKMLEKFPEFDTIILGSELMPWRVLGKGLIDNDYWAYYDAYNTHNNYLKNSNLYQKLEALRDSEPYKKYQSDKATLGKKEMEQLYKPHLVRQYEAFNDLVVLDLPKQAEAIEVFKRQVETFGVVGPIEFKPFNILKIISKSGEETLPNDNLSFADVNDDPFLHLVFTEENEAENLANLYRFFEDLTAGNEEGIMIKPRKSYIKDLPPCFKVRNNNYLTMIYGVNFSMDFEYYLNKRNVQKKLEQSISGWEINKHLLEVPYKTIDAENYLIKLLVLKRLQGEEIEKTLDSRL